MDRIGEEVERPLPAGEARDRDPAARQLGVAEVSTAVDRVLDAGVVTRQARVVLADDNVVGTRRADGDPLLGLEPVAAVLVGADVVGDAGGREDIRASIGPDGGCGGGGGGRGPALLEGD